MDYMIDRTASTNLPSLSQMVDAALQTLKVSVVTPLPSLFHSFIGDVLE